MLPYNLDVNRMLDAPKNYTEFFDSNIKVFTENAGAMRVERTYAFQQLHTQSPEKDY